VIDHSYVPSVVNTQLLNPFKNTDPAVKIAFPGVNVNDREQANVHPPNPSLCVGNGFIIETTDLVRTLRRCNHMHGRGSASLEEGLHWCCHV
jgi:hypothetical protein